MRTNKGAPARRARQCRATARAWSDQPIADLRVLAPAAERGRWPSQWPSALPIAGAAIPPAAKPGRGPPAAECRAAEPAAQHTLVDQASSVPVNSPGPRDAAPRARQHHRNAGGPDRRSGATACFAEAASSSIRPRCAACHSAGQWNSSIRRDLPSPGSPTIMTNWPSPCRARSQRRINMAISSSRPTSGVRWRCPHGVRRRSPAPAGIASPARIRP